MTADVDHWLAGLTDPREPPDDYQTTEPASSSEPTVDAPKPDDDIDTFLNSPEPEYDWLVPDLLERGDRLILTGPEGGGKSTLLRQLAIQLAAGVHPFTLGNIDPLNTWLLDLENSARQVRRKIRPLRIAAGDNIDPQRLRLRVIPQGINLGNPVHQEWLDLRLQANQPDIIILGPLYKLADGDPTEEKTAKPVAVYLDQMRTKYGCAILIEAHQPHAVGASKRTERPYGWSGWVRWPEFGLHLTDKGHLHHWRGGRDERAWPAALKRGGEWPWTPETDTKQLTFAAILDEVRRAGTKLSVRDLADRLGADRNHVQRAIDNNRNEWQRTLDLLTESDL